MKVSTKGRYALRMMLDLALHNTGEYIALKDISARQMCIRDRSVWSPIPGIPWTLTAC